MWTSLKQTHQYSLWMCKIILRHRAFYSLALALHCLGLLSAWNPDFTELGAPSLPLGWGSPAPTPRSREEHWGLPSAFLPWQLSLLAQLSRKRGIFFPKEGACKGQAGQQLPGIWRSGFSPQSHDGHGQGTVENAGAWCQQLQAGCSGTLLGLSAGLWWEFTYRGGHDLLTNTALIYFCIVRVLMERRGFQQWQMLKGWKSLKGKISSFSSLLGETDARNQHF